jgi:transcriptional regulator with XRE-family HTH domain
MDINDIFERLFNYFQTSTIRELSEKINMSESTVSKWRQRESINAIKKRCRELGIYNDIFGDSFNTFTQTGANSQQIKNQNNTGNGAGAFHYANDPKTQIDNNLNIDDDLIPLFQAISIVAKALNKKDKLKEKLENLISDLPKL